MNINIYKNCVISCFMRYLGNGVVCYSKVVNVAFVGDSKLVKLISTQNLKKIFFLIYF